MKNSPCTCTSKNIPETAFGPRSETQGAETAPQAQQSSINTIIDYQAPDQEHRLDYNHRNRGGREKETTRLGDDDATT